MMTDAEQIEVWRKEFESWFDLHTNKNHGVSYYVGANNKYCFTDIELAWQAFLIAKQNQPVILLPKNEFPEMTSRDAGYNLALSECRHAITAAGYKFTIGE